MDAERRIVWKEKADAERLIEQLGERLDCLIEAQNKARLLEQQWRVQISESERGSAMSEVSRCRKDVRQTWVDVFCSCTFYPEMLHAKSMLWICGHAQEIAAFPFQIESPCASCAEIRQSYEARGKVFSMLEFDEAAFRESLNQSVSIVLSWPLILVEHDSTDGSTPSVEANQLGSNKKDRLIFALRSSLFVFRFSFLLLLT